MLKANRILLGCACFMLAASVVVATIALIFHPSKSEAAKVLEHLKPDIQCLLCSAGLEKKGCDMGICKSKSENKHDDDDCSLTDGRKKYLSEIVQKKLESAGSQKSHIKTIKKAMNMEKGDDSLLKQIQSLNLNVPRPSAHWYLNESSARPKITKDLGTAKRYVSWIWETGTEMAHSQNGIEHENDQMKFLKEGFYHIYFQIDFRSHDVKNHRFVARVFVSGKTVEETSTLIKVEKTSTCGHHQIEDGGGGMSKPLKNGRTSKHKHHKNHSCAILKGSGVFDLSDGSLVGMEIEPGNFSINTDMSRSYFGAMYLRQKT